MFNYAAQVYRIVLLTFSILAPPLLAQTTVAELRSRLVRKPLYLRGQWSKDSLKFDEAGQLIGTSSPMTFTLSGINVTSLTLTKAGLQLEGTRVGLEFKHDVPKRVELEVPEENARPGTKPQLMVISVKRPTSGDFKEPLDRIFVEGLDDLLPSLPFYWQDYGQKHFVSASNVPSAPASGAGSTTTLTNPPTSPPRLLASVEPSFNQAAACLHYGGKVLLSLQVDASGKPSHFEILSPLGLGLDDRALAAVSKYTFAPATQNGKPVAAEVHVEVNFQIN